MQAVQTFIAISSTLDTIVAIRSAISEAGGSLCEINESFGRGHTWRVTATFPASRDIEALRSYAAGLADPAWGNPIVNVLPPREELP